MSEQPPERTAALRRTLIDQVAYLVDEIDVLQVVIGRVPDAILEGHPVEGDRSIKEMYGLLAAADEAVFLPRIERMIADDHPVFEALDPDALLQQEPWDTYAMEDILQRVRRARQQLVGALERLSEADWEREADFGEERYNIYALAHHITQHDSDVLREAGQRLHDSGLGGAARGMPAEPGPTG